MTDVMNADQYDVLLKRAPGAAPTLSPQDATRCPSCHAEETFLVIEDVDDLHLIHRRGCAICHGYFNVLFQCVAIELSEGPW